MMKPYRGAQPPSISRKGINPFSLIKFLEEAERMCKQKGDEESAFKFEMMVEYFKQDYEEGKPLKFSGQVLGY